MKLDSNKIKEILTSGNYVRGEDLAQAESQAVAKHTSLVEYLISARIITGDILGQAIAEYFKVVYADLNSNPPDIPQVLKIPENWARKYRVVLFKEEPESVIITTDTPSVELLAALKPLFPSKTIKIAYSLTQDIEATLVKYRKILEARFVKIINEQKSVAPEIISEIIEDALIYRASDVHFEPQGDEVVIRFRVDGVLQEVGRVPKGYYENILNRIKVQARLRTDEHSAAQDGAIRYQRGDEAVDIRVSIAPTLDGEKVVLRLLSEYVRGFTLEDLGLSAPDERVLLESIKKPYGMILSTGPTGCGKTTTLYAILKILNRTEANITTIEDPVEYKILGVNHIQINPLAEITFSKGLRSIIRQDPDVILVGEIRDKETAEIAVNAALTGQLLLSTFHANDASTAITRLLDMGVEPFLLASTVELIIAQRLVRRICDSCRVSKLTKRDDLEKIVPNAKFFFSSESFNLYEGKGCKACNNSGYKGRTAIFEFIQNSLQLQDLVLKNPSTKQIWELVIKQGTKPIFYDGVEKVKSGVTTLEELLRVASPPRV